MTLYTREYWFQTYSLWWSRGGSVQNILSSGNRGVSWHSTQNKPLKHWSNLLFECHVTLYTELTNETLSHTPGFYTFPSCNTKDHLLVFTDSWMRVPHIKVKLWKVSSTTVSCEKTKAVAVKVVLAVRLWDGRVNSLTNNGCTGHHVAYQTVKCWRPYSL